MKKIFAISVLFFVLGCKVTEKPEFKKVDSIKVIKANKKGVKVKADLVFLNRNSVGGTLQAKDIKVLVDSVEVATINSDVFNVPKKENFTMPLTVIIPYSKIFKNSKQNLLEGIMNVIQSKKVSLKYIGKVRYSLGPFHYDYSVDYTDEIKIK
jgi:hypothetical protein